MQSELKRGKIILINNNNNNDNNYCNNIEKRSKKDWYTATSNRNINWNNFWTKRKTTIIKSNKQRLQAAISGNCERNDLFMAKKREYQKRNWSFIYCSIKSYHKD